MSGLILRLRAAMTGAFLAMPFCLLRAPVDWQWAALWTGAAVGFTLAREDRP